MKLHQDSLRLSPTDLAGHLSCQHLTQLQRAVAERRLQIPRYRDPRMDAMQERGLHHEQDYLDRLRTAGRTLCDLRDERDPAATVRAMREGHGAIVQAALAHDGFHGVADVLLRVETPSELLGAYSYEPVDTKLARETQAGTILQLATYAEMLGAMQGRVPDQMHVFTPLGAEPYRVADFDAYHRFVRQRLLTAVTGDPPTTYPDPVAHCDICAFWQHCDRRRRADDHPSLVAGIHTLHVQELQRQQVATLTALATTRGELAEPPARGRPETFRRLGHQAALQLAARTAERPPCEALPIEAGRGLCRLPAPDPGDMFLDFEGDPFACEHGGGEGKPPPHEAADVMWQRIEDRLLLLELLLHGRARRRRAQTAAFATLAELPWTALTGRRDEIALVEDRRPELVALVSRVWPDWTDALARLTEKGLPPTPEGWARLEEAQRLALLPPLPPQINRRTAAALGAAHSKAGLRPALLAALGDTATTHDGSVRLRPPLGLLARTPRGELDLGAVARVLGEVAIPERALREGLTLAGPMRAVLLVENLGAWRDLPDLAGWLFVHVPGWDTPTAALLLDRLAGVPVVHFGDLDPNGVRILQHLRQWRADVRWFVPRFWEECLVARGQPGEWPEGLDLRDAPALVQRLAEQGRWLEQETIVLDPRLPPALLAMLA